MADRYTDKKERGTHSRNCPGEEGRAHPDSGTYTTKWGRDTRNVTEAVKGDRVPKRAAGQKKGGEYEARTERRAAAYTRRFRHVSGDEREL